MVRQMLFSKKKSRFDELKKQIFKRLSEIESLIKGDVQKEITNLIDRAYLLKSTKSDKAIKTMEDTLNYTIELKKEMINPVDLIIHNYVQKIELLINQVQYESEG